MSSPTPPDSGPFPANVPEAERWRHPSPTHQEVERQRSGGLPDDPSTSGNPVRNGPKPYRWG